MRRRVQQPCPILVVEDDPDVREVLQDVLREEGFEVSAVNDGVEALAVLATLPRPGVLLLDWLLPRLDGPGLLQRLEDTGGLAGLTVVVTTGFAGPIEDARVARVLRKPHDMGELLQVLDVLCP